MTNEAEKVILQYYERFMPTLKNWIDNLLIQYEHASKYVSELKFSRLGQYFSRDILESTKVIYVERPPLIPLSAMGLKQFSDFECLDFDKITYGDTFFVRTSLQEAEDLHFHELVHVLQWKILGIEKYLLLYGLELLKNTYTRNYLEVMASHLQTRFQQNPEPFDVEAFVRTELGKKSVRVFE